MSFFRPALSVYSTSRSFLCFLSERQTTNAVSVNASFQSLCWVAYIMSDAFTTFTKVIWINKYKRICRTRNIKARGHVITYALSINNLSPQMDGIMSIWDFWLAPWSQNGQISFHHIVNHLFPTPHSLHWIFPKSPKSTVSARAAGRSCLLMCLKGPKVHLILPWSEDDDSSQESSSSPGRGEKCAVG